MSDDTEIALTGHQGGFSVDEAFDLLYLHVVRTESLQEPPSIEHIGFIAGVLCFNEEVEIVVKFVNELRQYTKDEFSAQLVVVDDEYVPDDDD